MVLGDVGIFLSHNSFFNDLYFSVLSQNFQSLPLLFDIFSSKNPETHTLKSSRCSRWGWYQRDASTAMQIVKTLKYATLVSEQLLC